MSLKTFNKKDKEVFDYIKKHHLVIIKEYKGLSHTFSIHKTRRTSAQDKLIMKLFGEIFTRTIEEIENSKEIIKMEQYVVSDEMTTIWWYPTNFWKTSFACKWYDGDTWKKYKKVRYKEILLKDLVKQLLSNFTEYYGKDDEWKKRDISSHGFGWKLLGHCFIWKDIENLKE